MTKTREGGENEFTRQARAEAALTGRHVCEILASMLADAKVAGDVKRIRKIIRAQKYLGCRNIRKRRSNP